MTPTVVATAPAMTTTLAPSPRLAASHAPLEASLLSRVLAALDRALTTSADGGRGL